jgi:hypothetical protein
MILIRGLFCIILFCFHSFAQVPDQYLLKINIPNGESANRLERLNLPAYHTAKNCMFAILEASEINKLGLLNIQYNIIDKKNEGDKYYLISSFDNLTKDELPISTLFKGERFAIIKNIQHHQGIWKGRFHTIELTRKIQFRNQRVIVPSSWTELVDTVISEIVSLINTDSVEYFIQSLEDFGTRYKFASTRDSVAFWIRDQFLSMGYSDAILDSVYYENTWQKNVIATLPGNLEPDKINIVGAHHDSYAYPDPMNYAPGADDNGSGVAAVLEIARVLKEINYTPKSTIKFITFAAEEGGGDGSTHYAMKLFDSGIDVKSMFNHDMISYTEQSVFESFCKINYFSGFEYLLQLATTCTEEYSILTPEDGELNAMVSDGYIFWSYGFPTVRFSESDFSPYWHTTGDTIENYNMEYCAEVIKASCATLLTNIKLPAPVKNYQLLDRGDGNSLILSWEPNKEPNLEGYKVYIGTETGLYDSSFITIDTLIIISGLTEGENYFVGVSAYDSNALESLIIERSAIPLTLPLPPLSLAAEPEWLRVKLLWRPNDEFDLLGYNIYRSSIEGEPGELLNTNAFADTTYTDSTTLSGIYYYYTVKAIDSLLNESINNSTVKSRMISLDQGILIVDETVDGDGSPMNPTDEQVDEFYADLFSLFTITEYDLVEEGSIDLTILGAYSAVIWHGNDFTEMNAPFEHKQRIADYLDYGGNFLYTGYRPSTAFEQVMGLNGSFTVGDFIFDYLKILESKSSVFGLFNGTVGTEPGYVNIFVDSLKTLPSEQYHLKYIESIQPSVSGIAIYNYHTAFDSTSPQGTLNGKPVGVEYIGSDFRTITLSFPLYYMNKTDAKILMEFILTNKFNETTPVEDEHNQLPGDYSLSQNYPNPFNSTTNIRFTIPNSQLVSIKVYDILGNEIATLINEKLDAGRHQVSFNAGNLASGVYIYRLQADKFEDTKGFILMK